MLAEVALTFHYFSDAVTPSDEISAPTLALAIRFMRRVAQHSYYLYSGIISSSSAFELAQALARSIVAAKEPLETIGRDFMTQHCSSFRKADDQLRREAIQMLEDADWIGSLPNEKGYGGWPKKFAVNPRVFELYGREGAEWRKRRAQVIAMIDDTEDTA